MQLINKWDEQQRRDVAAMFVSPGWAVLKQEFANRRTSLINQLIASTDPEKDKMIKAGIAALDMFARLETNLFAPPDNPQPFVIPQVERADRY